MHSAAILGVSKSAATMLWEIPSLTNQLLLVSDPKKRGKVPPNWQWPPTGMNIGPSLVQWQGRECDCKRQFCRGLPPPLGLPYTMCLATRWRGQRRTVGTKEFPSCQSLLIPSADVAAAWGCTCDSLKLLYMKTVCTIKNWDKRCTYIFLRLCFAWRLYVHLRTETKDAHTFSYSNLINWGMYV